MGHYTVINYNTRNTKIVLVIIAAPIVSPRLTNPERGELLPRQRSTLRDDGAADGHRHFGRAREPQATLPLGGVIRLMELFQSCTEFGAFSLGRA